MTALSRKEGGGRKGERKGGKEGGKEKGGKVRKKEGKGGCWKGGLLCPEHPLTSLTSRM